eukprot:PhF_6_TR27331/c0_g2_i1/m.40153
MKLSMLVPHSYCTCPGGTSFLLGNNNKDNPVTTTLTFFSLNRCTVAIEMDPHVMDKLTVWYLPSFGSTQHMSISLEHSTFAVSSSLSIPTHLQPFICIALEAHQRLTLPRKQQHHDDDGSVHPWP